MLRFDRLGQIDGINVNLILSELVCDLLGLDEEKFPLLFKFRANLLQRFQTHLPRVAFPAKLHPLFTKAFHIPIQCSGLPHLAPLFNTRHLHPLLTPAQKVMVRQSEKVVTLLFIPIDNHVRKIIPVTPKRVGMRVPLIPGSFLIPDLGLFLFPGPHCNHNRQHHCQQQ